MIYITPVIETKRLSMHRGNSEDYKAVYEYDFTKMRNILGEDELIKCNAEKIEGYEIPYKDSYDWIVYLKETFCPIANITADRIDREFNSIELAFNMHPSYQRQGYMTEALYGIIEFLYTKGFNNIICGYDEGNYKSENLIKKLGFIAYKKIEASWIKNGVPINTYLNILPKDKYYETKINKRDLQSTSKM